MSKVIHGRGYVYSLQYHLVWCVKYRRKVLTNEIEKSLKEILIELCKDHEITIEEMETDKDHIHMLISLKPQHYIPTVVKTLKGHPARRLFKLHPEIKGFLWGDHLWNPSYFIETVSENTEAQVRGFIQNQNQNQKQS